MLRYAIHALCMMRNRVTTMRKSFLVCMIMGVVLGFFSGAFSDRGGSDTLMFSHRVHTEDVEAGCVVCHSAAKESTLASDRLFPTMETCGGCHEVEDESECGTCHTKPELAEVRVDGVRTIRFSHQRHLATGTVGCLDCHGGVERSEVLKERYIPPMEVCMRCHEGDMGATGCAVCHVQVEGLRPTSHDADWSGGHGWFVRAGDETCAMCHQESSCGECHAPGALVGSKESPKDLHGLFAFRLGDGSSMILEEVHDLGFRYTHPQDVKAKERDCSTCHETSFCVTCHGSGEGGKPVWHGGEGWGAWAGEMGTGGGRHAELARRDIEQCAGCHDTRGADPVCLLCHMDRMPGRGNDPRTHDAGFSDAMDRGPWHEDEGWVCYTCHLFKKGPEGFCQYCHGEKD